MPTWSRHVKSNCGVPFRIKQDTPHPTAIHDHAILFNLCRNSFKHGRAEIMSLRIFIPYLNDGGKAQSASGLCFVTKRKSLIVTSTTCSDCARSTDPYIQARQTMERTIPNLRHCTRLAPIVMRSSIYQLTIAHRVDFRCGADASEAARSRRDSRPCERPFPPCCQENLVHTTGPAAVASYHDQINIPRRATLAISTNGTPSTIRRVIFTSMATFDSNNCLTFRRA